jgi:curli biogenesis system outer membrane secretion channel CsgG
MGHLMKFLLILIPVISIIAGCSSHVRPEPVPYEKRLLIAVGDMQNRTGDTNYNSILDPMTGMFISELQKTSCFRLVERQRLKSLLEEMKLSMSGLTDPDHTREVGRLLGVDAFLFVDITSVIYDDKINSVGESIENGNETFNVTSDARLSAVDTGEILASSTKLETLKNSYSRVGSISNGQKADKKVFVQRALEASVESLASDIACQISKKR